MGGTGMGVGGVFGGLSRRRLEPGDSDGSGNRPRRGSDQRHLPLSLRVPSIDGRSSCTQGGIGHGCRWSARRCLADGGAARDRERDGLGPWELRLHRRHLCWIDGGGASRVRSAAMVHGRPLRGRGNRGAARYQGRAGSARRQGRRRQLQAPPRRAGTRPGVVAARAVFAGASVQVLAGHACGWPAARTARSRPSRSRTR